MKRHEFLIDRLRAVATDTTLSEAESKRLHVRYAELYWNAVGIPPDLRDELSTAMDLIVEHADRSVDDVINELRHRIYSIPLESTS